jgi:hypothetical protein
MSATQVLILIGAVYGLFLLLAFGYAVISYLGWDTGRFGDAIEYVIGYAALVFAPLGVLALAAFHLWLLSLIGAPAWLLISGAITGLAVAVYAAWHVATDQPPFSY